MKIVDCTHNEMLHNIRKQIFKVDKPIGYNCEINQKDNNNTGWYYSFVKTRE